MRNVKLGKKMVGDGFSTYVIAEIGGNFTNFLQAKKMIDAAYEAGADAVKLQTYRAETISSRKAMYDMENTGIANQYELFKKYEIDFELHKEIWAYCRENDISIFSTPSHITDVELLEELDCSIYKIGSDDACNIPFLKEIASVGKPIILSTGMCTLEEVRESVSAIHAEGNSDLILLHCVTNYPAAPEHANLACVPRMKEEFGLPIGYSDHTIGNTVCIGAVALGANVVEKHFTYDKKAEGPDHMLSADPSEFKQIVDSIRIIEEALGDGIKRPSQGELKTRINNRKSIIAQADLTPGTIISKELIAIKRPGTGIPPKHYEEILGRCVKETIEKDDPIVWEKL